MRSVGARPGGVEETARQQDGEGDHDQRQADAQDIAGDMGGSPAPRLLPRDMGDDAAVFLFLVHRNLSFPWGENRHADRLVPGKARFVPISCRSAPAVKELRYGIAMMAAPRDRFLQLGPRSAEPLPPEARIPPPPP